MNAEPLCLCVFMSVCICLCYLGVCNTFRWLVCPLSGRSASVTDKYLAVEGSEQWICCLAIIQCVLLCHSFSHVSAGTLSVCVNEKTAHPLLHTVALQFLCTVFTEETKSQSAAGTNAHPKHATALTEIVIGPSASQLCELLLQVCGGGHVVVSVISFCENKTKHWCLLLIVWLYGLFFFNCWCQSFEKKAFQDPLKKLTARALMTLLACSPAAQNHAAKGNFAKPQAAARQSAVMSFLKI